MVDVLWSGSEKSFRHFVQFDVLQIELWITRSLINWNCFYTDSHCCSWIRDTKEYSKFVPYVSKSVQKKGLQTVQIGEHHIVDASSEEEVCTLARYVALHHYLLTYIQQVQ